MQYYIEQFTNCTSLSHRFIIRVKVIRHVLAKANFHWLLLTYKYSSAFCILGKGELFLKNVRQKGELSKRAHEEPWFKKRGIGSRTFGEQTSNFESVLNKT